MTTQKRKPGRPKGPPSIPVCIRVPESQYDEYMKRGGAKWLKGLMADAVLKARAKSE